MNNTTFNHSVKVPQNYKKIAKALQKILEGGVGLKAAIYNNQLDYDRNSLRNLAVTTKILQKYPQIEHVLNTTEILSKEPSLDPWLARVIIYELLWHKDLVNLSKPILAVVSHKKEIHDALATYQGSDDSLETTKVLKPRYVRVNTFKASVRDVIDQLRHEGMILLPSIYETYLEFLEAVSTLQHYHFMVDFHIKNLLIFPSDTILVRHRLYIDGTLILQNKASVLSPMLLDPPEGSVVLDMCAAPGMKTTYVANQVGINGRVYAVERSQQRYQTLCNLIDIQGMKNIQCMHGDALKVTGDELADVEYILVDPSCSGSGLPDRIDFEKSQPNRLQTLASFQSLILRHALTRFPNVKRVAYSTCSIHPEENEEVVRSVLGAVDDFKLINLQEKMGSNWNNFGSDKYGEIGTSCLYARQDTDHTIGFFIAVFERVGKPSKKKRKYEDAEENTQNGDEEIEKRSKKKNKNTKYEDAEENSQNGDEEIEKRSKKKNKNNKYEDAEENSQNGDEVIEKRSKKKKKDNKYEDAEENTQNEGEEIEKRSKKTKKNNKYEDAEENTQNGDEEIEKKSKKKDNKYEDAKVNTQNGDEEIEKSKKKKKDNKHEDAEENTQNGDEEIEKRSKKKKDNKYEDAEENTQNGGEEIEKRSKKKKKNNKYEDVEENTQNADEEIKKKIKKKDNKYEDAKENTQNGDEEVEKSKKKKKDNKYEDAEENTQNGDEEREMRSKKKKNNKYEDAEENTQNGDEEIEKRSKKKDNKYEDAEENTQNGDEEIEKRSKKKDKKHKIDDTVKESEIKEEIDGDENYAKQENKKKRKDKTNDTIEKKKTKKNKVEHTVEEPENTEEQNVDIKKDKKKRHKKELDFANQLL